MRRALAVFGFRISVWVKMRGLILRAKLPLIRQSWSNARQWMSSSFATCELLASSLPALFSYQ
ncbi:hypothetical protein PLANPX_1172 [Lacipirellula parvula]|uniref:Uncharacterized protein n=1 Tax=Lacipirellula parvula TaxID=2650471 RepID=A0A5K7X4U1_9BACT|nr:hypothetical protein PLANPX_1172 [Lacipirellula parvula]